MIRRTMFFKTRDAATPGQVARLEQLVRATPQHIAGITRVSLGRDLDPRQLYTHVWDMDCKGPEVVQAYGPHPYHMETLMPVFSPRSPTGVVEKLDYAYYKPVASGARPIKDQGFIRRVMFFQMRSSATPEQVKTIEELLLELPKKVPAIGNWALNKTTGDRMPNPWTHVWELEFADLPGLDVYSKDRFHLDVVAPYFRPDSPKRVVEQINIAWYQAEAPLIARD